MLIWYAISTVRSGDLVDQLFRLFCHTTTYPNPTTHPRLHLHCFLLHGVGSTAPVTQFNQH
jgi:hypothetical protein